MRCLYCGGYQREKLNQYRCASCGSTAIDRSAPVMLMGGNNITLSQPQPQGMYISGGGYYSGSVPLVTYAPNLSGWGMTRTVR